MNNNLKSLNFPCVLLEKEDTKGVNVSEKNLLNKFALVRNQIELDEKGKYFTAPVLCHYYSVINAAIKIDALLTHQ